jgi:hypothetical protein
MGRQSRTPVGSLLQEVRAIELLASETEVEPHHLQEYWQLSTELIALSTEAEQFASEFPLAAEDDARVLDLRHRLRAIAAQLVRISAE